MSILNEHWTDTNKYGVSTDTVKTESGQYIFACTLESIRRHIIELHNKQVEEES